MSASGRIVDMPLAAANALNASALPNAEAAYRLMMQILQEGQQPLIFGSLALSAAAITEGLASYAATMALSPGSGGDRGDGE